MKYKYLLVFIFFSLLADVNVGQPPLPPNIPDTPQLEPTTLYHDPANYSVVFLLGENYASDRSVITPDGLFGELMQPTVIQSMDELLQQDSINPIEAIVIDQSALSWIDIEWTGLAYRRGVTFAGINLSIIEFATLQNTNCGLIRAENFTNVFLNLGVDYYFIVSDYFIADNAEDQALIEQEYFGRCNTSFSVSGPAWNKRRGTQSFLVSEEDIYAFSNTLMNHVNGIREAEANLTRTRQNLPPVSGEGMTTNE